MSRFASVRAWFLGDPWKLPPATPDKWWQTAKVDARAIRDHRRLWVLGIVLVVAASEIVGFWSDLHGPLKVVLIAVSAGGGAVFLIWLGSWVAALLIAAPRQRNEAIAQGDEARKLLLATQERQERLRGREPLHGERFRVAELVEMGQALVEHREFVDCSFVGPALLVTHSCTFIACTMPAKPQGYWKPSNERKVGLFAFFDCKFDRCRFIEHVGVVMDPGSTEYERITEL